LVKGEDCVCRDMFGRGRARRISRHDASGGGERDGLASQRNGGLGRYELIGRGIEYEAGVHTFTIGMLDCRWWCWEEQSL
jgi:hypothetical protein